MISVKTISTEDEIASLREKWDGLVEEEQLDISNSYDWSMCLLESHLEKKDISTIVVEEGARLLGIFPFFAKKKSINLIPINTICPVFYFHSVHNDLLLRRDKVEILDSIFDELAKAKKYGNWKLMEIPAVVVQGKTDQMLRAYLDEKGFHYRLLPGAASPFIKIGNRSWEEWLSEYLGNKNAKIRGNFKRRRKYIEQAGKLKIEQINDCSQIVSVLFAIENSSWKYRNGSAITNKKEQMMFYKLLINRLEKKVLFFVLSLDGVPVSYTLCILIRNKCYLLKTSYNDNYKKLSPGIVILMDLLKYCFDNNFFEFDFAGENEGYKLEFTNDIRNHNNYLIFNKGICPHLIYRLAQMISLLRVPSKYGAIKSPGSTIS